MKTFPILFMILMSDILYSQRAETKPTGSMDYSFGYVLFNIEKKTDYINQRQYFEPYMNLYYRLQISKNFAIGLNYRLNDFYGGDFIYNHYTFNDYAYGRKQYFRVEMIHSPINKTIVVGLYLENRWHYYTYDETMTILHESTYTFGPKFSLNSRIIRFTGKFWVDIFEAGYTFGKGYEGIFGMNSNYKVKGYHVGLGNTYALLKKKYFGGIVNPIGFSFDWLNRKQMTRHTGLSYYGYDNADPSFFIMTIKFGFGLGFSHNNRYINE